jgi:carboxypeptidase family protein
MLIAVVALPAASVSAQGRPSVSGVVYDSIAGRPLVGATVQVTGAAGAVVGRTASAVTDTAGRYSIRELAPGRYVGGFFHDALDTLGLVGEPRAVNVNELPATLDLATPSPRTIIATICGANSVTDSLGLLIGHIHQSGTSSPISDATVTVEWGETIVAKGSVTSRNMAADATTQGPGWFAMCDVPGEIELTLSASSGADSSGFVNVEVPRTGIRHVTFWIGGARRVPSAAVDTISAVDTTTKVLAPEMVWRGSARLAGIVRDERGLGVNGARVLVRGTNLATTSSDRGYFGLDSLPGGTHTLEVRAVGYLPATSTVNLAAEQPAQVEVFIGDRLVTLEAVKVTATLVFSRNLARFQTNRERNPGGMFVGPREIERFRGMRFSNLVQAVPGVRLSYNQGFTILMDYTGTDDGQSRGLCVPQFYIDGQRSQYTASEIEGLYRADELAGVEVYVRENQRPIEFQDSNSRCGAIAIWTRPQLRRPGGPPPA